jgi:hypothetical protein
VGGVAIRVRNGICKERLLSDSLSKVASNYHENEKTIPIVTYSSTLNFLVSSPMVPVTFVFRCNDRVPFGINLHLSRQRGFLGAKELTIS